MKHLFLIVLITFSAALIAQPKKDPKMAATLTPGYYCTLKGDTVKGEIQNNPLNGEPDFYKGFNFKPKGAGKVVAITTKKAKAYGFEGRNFTVMSDGSKGEVYVEYIAKGRLNFVEYKFMGSVAGQPGVETNYYIQDTKADAAQKELREWKELSPKFYKNEIKPYMKDQKATWEVLDKFTFNKDAIGNSIREFNRYYDTTPTKVETETERVTGEETEVKE